MKQTSCIKETNTKLIATVVCNQEVDESAAAAAPPSITQGQYQGQPLAAPNASVPVDTASPAVTPNMEGTTSKASAPVTPQTEGTATSSWWHKVPPQLEAPFKGQEKTQLKERCVEHIRWRNVQKGDDDNQERCRAMLMFLMHNPDSESWRVMAQPMAGETWIQSFWVQGRRAMQDIRDNVNLREEMKPLLSSLPSICYEKFGEEGLTDASSDYDKANTLVKLLGHYKGEAVEAVAGSSECVFWEGPCPDMPPQGGKQPWQHKQYLCYQPLAPALAEQ